jgi:hypothetical protein
MYCVAVVRHLKYLFMSSNERVMGIPMDIAGLAWL